MLSFSVNWLAVVLATIAGMALGFGWYTILSKAWLAALGKKREDIDASDYTPYIWSVVVQFVMAYFVAVLTPGLFETTTVGNGVMTALIAWFGFVLTSMILNHRYQGQKWLLTVIDSGYILGVLLLQGIVIGLFG
jgi:hypothetical protein